MTRRPRSLSFWLGLAGLTVIAGMWVSSLFWRVTTALEGDRCWLYLKSGQGTFYAEVAFMLPLDMGGPWDLDFDQKPPPYLVLELPESEVAFESPWTGSPDELSFLALLPYWLLCLAWIVLWSCLLAWRRRRQRKLAARMAMQQAAQG